MAEQMSFLDESILNFRVLPNDVDVRKMTNDRFIALMDLGRMDIAFRVGLIKPMIKRKWIPIATYDTIRFRYYLKIFQKYKLRTKIIFWNEKTFYFEQQFERLDRIVGTGYVCATCLGPEGLVSPKEMIASTGQSVSSPPKPDIVSKIEEAENLIHESQRDKY
jgi:acyl-CoA thioesterase FadM